MLFGGTLIFGGWGVVGWGGKSYLGPAEIVSFSSWNLSWYNKHDSFWLILTGYFYFLFLWVIVVSDFLHLEIYKNLVLPLSNITFTANNQADNYFYKYIYLFVSNIIQYEISLLLKSMLRFFIFKFDSDVKHRP